MFGTLRYDAHIDDTLFCERPTGPLNGKGEGQRPRYSACDKCRAKKQKCGGGRDGCERCIRTSSECVYSLQGKGRGRRRRDAAERTALSQADSPQHSAKRSPADKPRKRKVTAPGENKQRMRHVADDTISSLLLVDGLDNDIPTSGLMQSDILPGFDGQSIDDCLDSHYFSARHEFDPDFDLAIDYESLGNMPVQSLSDFSSVFEQSPSFESRSNLDSKSCTSNSPLPSLGCYSDGLPSPQSTSPACPTTPSNEPYQEMEALSTDKKENCQCLRSMAFLLEDLEIKGRNFDTIALDSILVLQKETLGRCNSALNCSACCLRPQLLLLLGTVTERLASIYESTVARYLDGPNECSPCLGDSTGERHLSQGDPMDDVKVCLGSYEVETRDERVSVIRLLIVSQLQSLKKLTGSVTKAVISRGEGEPQVIKVQAAERRLAELIRSIRRSEP